MLTPICRTRGLRCVSVMWAEIIARRIWQIDGTEETNEAEEAEGTCEGGRKSG